MLKKLIITSTVFAFAIGVNSYASVDRNNITGHWEGDLNYKGKVTSIKLDFSKTGETVDATIDLPEYIIYGCKCELTFLNDSVIVKPVFLPDVDLRLSLSDISLSGFCNGFQKVDSKAYLQKKSNDPVTYREEDIEFANGDGVLKGTLVLPGVGEGPFPTIVWTHGSPPQTRQTFHYVARAYLLAQHGVAGLIYDKRGAGESSGSENWNSENLIGDAQAAYNSLRKHPKVDDSKLGMGGFSQGGWIAPAVASQDNSVDFVLVGATPLVTGGGNNLFSMMRRLQLASHPEDEVQEAVAFMTLLYEFFQTGEDRELIVTALEQAKNSSWFENKTVQRVMFMPDAGLPEGKHPYWTPFSPDPSKAWLGVTVPVLSVWGAEDINLPADSCRKLLEQVLTKTGHNDFTLKVFPNAGHGLWNEEKKDDWDWTRQATGYHQLLVDWVTERFVE